MIDIIMHCARFFEVDNRIFSLRDSQLLRTTRELSHHSNFRETLKQLSDILSGVTQCKYNTNHVIKLHVR